eukprot:1176234-Prorocentrum_minimum.AAC.3
MPPRWRLLTWSESQNILTPTVPWNDDYGLTGMIRHPDLAAWAPSSSLSVGQVMHETAHVWRYQERMYSKCALSYVAR